MNSAPVRILVAARRPEDRAEAIATLRAAVPRYVLREAGTFAETLRLSREERPDCVLLHLDLPDAGIFQAVGALARGAGVPDVPVVVLASHLGGDLRRELVRAGAEDAIGCAAPPGALVQAVDHAVERRRGAHRRDAALHAELERGRIAIADTDDGVWDWDVLADRVYWSERWYRMLGYEPGAFVPSFESFIALVHPDDRSRVTAENDRHNATGTPAYEAEFRMRCADGSYRWILSRARSIFDEHGRMVRVVGFHVDVEARRRAEQSLARRTAGLELLNEGAAELLAARDPDVVIESLFRRVAAFVGADVYFHFRIEEQPPDPPVLRLAMSAGIDAEARRAFDRLGFGEAVCGVTACERGTQYRPDLQRSTDAIAAGLRALGLGVYSCYPLVAGEELLGTLGFGSRTRTGFEDDERTLLQATARHVAAVLHRTRVEQERERLLAAERAARIEADRAGRLKDEFLAMISHELRTPLNSILGWSRLLLRAGVRPEMYEEGVRVIERNAKVQSQLISDLLDVNHIASGRLRLELDRVDVNDAVVAALETVQAAARERGVAVASTLARDLPPVSADFARLQQVIWNLLANAIKFTPPGEAVTLATRLVADRVEVEVRDAGQGIAAEFLPHVFDRFRQADGSITRPHGGLGLGLAIVRQLIEMHGGEVSAESEGAGRGATFRIRLPALAGDPAAGDGAHGTPVNRDSLRGIEVLLVDDQADALEFTRRLLVEHGAEVRTASGADDALRVLRERGDDRLPRLLVSDIGMPGMDGYELLRAVRLDLGLGPDRLPAVAVTAFGRDDDRRDAQAVGYQAHLTKPFQPDRLIAALARLARPRPGTGAPSVLA